MSYAGPVGESSESLFFSLCGAAFSDSAINLIQNNQLDIPRHGEALLQAACRAGLYSVAELLVERGASITSRVAVSAAAGGNVALFKAINLGCSAFRDNLGEMLFHADDNGHFHMVRHLLDNGAPIRSSRMEVLMMAAEKGSLRKVSYLAEKGANQAFFLGKALSAAACGGHSSIVIHLLNNGANVDFNQGEPLSNAASKGDMTMVQLLEERGANLRTNYYIALCSAASSGNVGLVAYLLSKGADVNAQNGSPLSNAASKGDIQLSSFSKQGVQICASTTKRPFAALPAVETSTWSPISWTRAPMSTRGMESHSLTLPKMAT